MAYTIDQDTFLNRKREAIRTLSEISLLISGHTRSQWIPNHSWDIISHLPTVSVRKMDNYRPSDYTLVHGFAHADSWLGNLCFNNESMVVILDGSARAGDGTSQWVGTGYGLGDGTEYPEGSVMRFPPDTNLDITIRAGTHFMLKFVPELPERTETT